MCEQTEVNYLDGEVVWVKLGSCWWPGEVVALEKLPPDVQRSFRKPPIAVVKFFQEDTYEYVKNINSIYKYNCSRKNEFINKGLYMYRTKHGHMEKFPEDIIRAETSVGGDIEILTRDEFQEPKKESYAGIFGDPKKTPVSLKKGKSGRGRPPAESPKISTPVRKIKEKTDYKVHILVQGSKPALTSETNSEVTPTPSTSGADPTHTEDKPQDENKPQNDVTPNEEKPVSSEEKSVSTPATPSKSLLSNSAIYACHACSFTTTRLNVLILHNKTHSVSFIPYTPSPIRKKPVTKSPPKSTPSKTPKPRKPRKEKTEKPPKKLQAKKRTSEEKLASTEVKKPKTDEEIKSSLLADWDDDVDDESNDESSTMVSTRSPEVPVGAESPAVPTPAELPSAQVPDDMTPIADKKSNSSPSTEKPESSSDSKYEFCEDEDWPEEADVGRKIPRVKNPIRTEDIKSVSIDEDEVAREVAELLNKTAVPELPSVPEPLKIEENFPEPSIVKSPDKKQDKSPEKLIDKGICENPPTKAIFKTKTFFRSRHSRSQDAIGKYVAEQLNAVEKMDIAESEINGSEAVSSPEARDSPPIEPIKVARLAPKIQLKKMKAEAAQLREKEKNITEPIIDVQDISHDINITEASKSVTPPIEDRIYEKDIVETSCQPQPIQNVLYPTQEIRLPDTNIKIPSTETMEEPNTDAFMEVDKTQNVEEEEISKLPVKESNDMQQEIQFNQESEIDVKQLPTIKFPELTLPENNENPIESLLNKKSQEQQIGPYMNESTASAVDALLSVSREVDRVPRAVTNDLPEDLFEDDNKDSEPTEHVNGDFNEARDSKNGFHEENRLKQVQEVPQVVENVLDQPGNDFLESPSEEILHNEELVNATPDDSKPLNSAENKDEVEPVVENVPSESDLQVAEALINLPSTALQCKTPTEHKEHLLISTSVEDENQEEIVPVSENVVINETEIEFQEKEICTDDMVINETEIIESSEDSSLALENEPLSNRFETEQEKSENLNAAQSLVQMSETIDHKINIVDPIESIDAKETTEDGAFNAKQNNGIDICINTVEQNVALLSNDNNSETTKLKSNTYDPSSSKLLKILEEPCKPKISINKTTPTKQIIMQGKEKILNFDVAKSSFKSKTPKQKIIIRRTAPPNKTVLNNVKDSTGSEKIILSRSGNPSQDGSSVQTYTIQTSPDVSSDANTIIIQQKIRKITKPATQTKLQKIKPQTSLVAPAPVNEVKSIPQTQTTDDTMFDINSMPIVLSEDLLTPENIEKMPVVMSDGNIISQSQSTTKVIKSKQNVIEHDKVVCSTSHKQEIKTLLMNPAGEVSKSVTPNILSKSSKLRGAKPMLVIDKTTGKQKIIMTKTEPAVKEVKQMPTLIQPAPQAAKTEKFIILPTQSSSPRPARTQKIVIDPQTGKAHVFVAKGSEAPLTATDNKPVSAKLVPSNSDTNVPGNTVMIITNAQGAQSRIVLTPEHEKILFPNKQQPNVSQLKTVAHRISTTPAQKTLMTAIAPVKTQTMAPVKTPTRIVPKQKSAIITSKGQLIVGGRVATTAQNIAPMPELRPVSKRIVTSEPKKLVQTIQKSNSEPIIFLQQKSGAVMQLTAAQFEHLHRTGQIVHKSAPVQEKIVIQKTKSFSESGPSIKPRTRKTVTDSPTPAKRIKQEIAIAPSPAPPTLAPAPALTTSTSTSVLVPSPSNTISIPSSSTYSEFDNFEELLPSTAIARQQEPMTSVQAEPAAALAAAPPATLADGQLLAVPGEHFGGPAGTFYLCVEDSGTFTSIDNRPLVLENNQLVPMVIEAVPTAPQPERRDILEAALANSDVFHADTPRDEAPDFRDLNANVSVHCRVSETSTTLNQPIMTPVEMPSKVDTEPTVPSNLEDGLAVIGVTPLTVPTSLELPITVTDPRIAPKTTDPLSNNNYGAALLPSPNTELFVGAEHTEIGGPISMPLLTEEEAVGKSMPILTDEVAERTVSSMESATGSPSSLEVRESEPEEGGQWTRRLLTPGSDSSETSAEIPLQPSIQLSVGDLSHHS